MQTISKEEISSRKIEIAKRIIEGAIFIHPTDTIYGIGCDASNPEAVKRVRDAKNRYERPFSVIVPNKEWIEKNCVVNKRVEKWIEKLPGPYTLILKLKNQDGIAENVNPGLDTIGVRIPNHWISGLSTELEIPIITTSANLVGNDFMTSMDSLDSNIQKKMDFIIYEGEKSGRPSQIVDLTKDEKVIKR
jgi:L-threonylcarbamoyladenylate synthase